MSAARNDLGLVIVNSKAEIDLMPWNERDDKPGVRNKILWQSGDVVLGVMRIDAGHENPVHTHHGAHHHLLIIDGECTILGKRVGPESYIYIPPGVPHGATDVGPEGCTFFYTYRPLEDSRLLAAAEPEHGHPV